MAKDRIKNYAQGTSEINILKDIRTDLSVTPSTYTPDTSTVTRDRLVTFAQAEEELAVLGDVERGVRNLVGDVNKNENDIANIKALLQGHLYDYQTDSTSAYTKSVPAGAMPYAGLEKVGGKTVVWNQLADPTRVITCQQGATVSPDVASNISFVQGHKYIVGHYQEETLTSVERNRYQYRASLSDAWHYQPNDVLESGRHWWIFTSEISSSGTGDIHLWIQRPSSNVTAKDFIFCDLTLMFGAGNEPTAEQFEALFPADNYAISTPTLLSAGVTEVVSKDGNNSTLQTYSIPASIQALEGYGWSAGTAYNYVDFEAKKFVQNVARVDLGSFTWTKVVEGNGNRFYTSEYLSLYNVTAVDVVGNFICSKYVSQSINYVTSHSDSSIGIYTSKAINIRDNAYDDATTFKSAMSGVYLYYELATPIETDISQYLTDDNLIQVESGGTLTFENQHGTDYQIPVPSEETYMIDLQEAINNG